MKIGIVGRGAIGLTCAYELSKRGFSDITIIGSRNNAYSASRAAGAMLNIVSEIDTFNANHPLTSWKVSNKTTVLNLWDNLMTNLSNDRAIPKSLLYGKGTEIIIKAGGTSNEVELNSYQAMKDAHSELSGNSKAVNTCYKLSNECESFLIEDEPSVDSNAFLEGLETYLRINAKNIFQNVIRVLKCDSQWVLELFDGNLHNYDYIILCAGSWTESIIDRSPCIRKPSRKSFFGVGSALLISSELDYVQQPSFDRIIRTPNRGGTCGIHAVQRENHLYVGASSVITNLQIKNARVSSVHALIDGLKDTLSIDINQLSSNVITGYRPVTDDAVPVIGELDSGLFCCYGTKRDGFTWAPFFAHHISNFVQKSSNICSQWEELLNQCAPYRELTSAGDASICIENYVVNKIFESHQHGKKLTGKETDLLHSIATKVHHYAEQNTGKQIGIQPELVNMFYYVIMSQQ